LLNCLTIIERNNTAISKRNGVFIKEIERHSFKLFFELFCILDCCPTWDRDSEQEAVSHSIAQLSNDAQAGGGIALYGVLDKLRNQLGKYSQNLLLSVNLSLCFGEKRDIGGILCRLEHLGRRLCLDSMKVCLVIRPIVIPLPGGDIVYACESLLCREAVLDLHAVDFVDEVLKLDEAFWKSHVGQAQLGVRCSVHVSIIPEGR